MLWLLLIQMCIRDSHSIGYFSSISKLIKSTTLCLAIATRLTGSGWIGFLYSDGNHVAGLLSDLRADVSAHAEYVPGRPHAHEAAVIGLAVESSADLHAALAEFGAHIVGEFHIRAVQVLSLIHISYRTRGRALRPRRLPKACSRCTRAKKAARKTAIWVWA